MLTYLKTFINLKLTFIYGVSIDGALFLTIVIFFRTALNLINIGSLNNQRRPITSIKVNLHSIISKKKRKLC